MAVKVTALPVHIVVALAVMLTVGVALLPTVIITALDVSVAGTAQVALDVSTAFTTSPLARAVLAYVLLLVPTTVPFLNHWYVGEPPPLTGVAVNVTFWPAQIEVDEALTVTSGATLGATVMVMVLLLAELVPEQPLTDVKVSDTTSPLASVVVLKVALLVPALLPFTFHW